MQPDTAPVEKTSEFGKDTGGIAKRWIAELNQAEREFDDWNKRVDEITDRYRDKTVVSGTTVRPRRFNVLWSNIQTTMPALYNRTPLPVVERRFSDQDPVARTGGMILERALMTEHAISPFDDEVKKSILDYALGGRGVTWVRYEFKKGPVPVPDAPGETVEDVVEQSAPCDHVNRKDFRHSPARTWSEVRWVARRSYMTRDDLVKRFGKKVGEAVPLDYEPSNISQEVKDAKEYDLFKKAMVWEIWNKPDNEVVWISLAYGDAALDRKPPPLKLQDFFPCPRPFYGTLTNETLVPVPDYDEYRDQAEQIDELTARIALLTKAVRVAGAYAGSQKDTISQILDPGSENVLVPVDSWTAYAEKGGLKGMIDWLPIETIATVLDGLIKIRNQLLQDLYQITGISDIMRGAGAASESASGVKLKAQFGSLRISDRQNEVKRGIRDIVRIQAEIMADKFTPEILVGMSGIREAQGANKEVLAEVFALLRNDRFRDWKIDVETDDTQMRDPDIEKQSAIEFIAAFGAFLERAIPLAGSAPPLTPVIGETAMFLLRKFRVARSLESTFEQALPKLMEQAKQQKGLQDQAQQQAVQGEDQNAQLQAETQEKQQKWQMEREDNANRMAFEREKHADEMNLRREEMAGNQSFKREEMQATAAQKAQPSVVVNPENANALTALMQSLQAMNEQNNVNTQVVADTMGNAAQLIAQAAAQIAAPKKIEVVRDSNQKVVGANVHTTH